MSAFVKKPDDKDIHALTALRGFAAALVVAYHYKIYESMPSPVSTFIRHGYLCVDLFFILSGFVIALTYGKVFANGFKLNNYYKFLGKRFARIYPLYALLTVIALPLYIYGFSSDDISPLNILTILSNLTLTQTWGVSMSILGPAWSISTELFAYFLFPVMAYCCLYSSGLLAIVSGSICFLMLALIGYLPESLSHITHVQGPLDISRYTDIGPILRCIFEFSIGILCWRVSQLDQARYFAASHKFSPMISIIILVAFFISNSDLVLIVFFPILIIALTDNRTPLARILSQPIPMWLGDISYSVYLIHELVSPCRQYLQTLIEFLNISHSYTISLIITYFIVFGIATFTFKYIELPARKKLRKIFDKQQKPILGL